MDVSPTHDAANERAVLKSRRTYVACVPCRNRKVKCQIHESPPCAKCRREHRECYFRPTKTGPKHRDPPRWTQDDSNASYTQTAAEIVPEESASPPANSRFISDAFDGHVVDGCEGSASTTEASGPQTDGGSARIWRGDQVMSSVIAQPRHALEVLFTTGRPDISTRQGISGVTTEQSNSQYQALPEANRALETNDRPNFYAPSPLSVVADDVLDSWDNFRFVRQGWFTAQEAVTYLDLFFENLSPMCPILLDRYKDHNNHKILILEEPMLCCTLLAISSRFHVLTGPGGYSRGHWIHSRLWQYCERLIQRLMMGQEKTSSAKIRTIGTIEAFMLISDWHPRALHFPPETDGWDSAFLPEVWKKQDRVGRDGNAPFIRWQEDVFEAARRSDRMSWMLLGAATSLMCELEQNPEDLASLSTNPNTARSLRAKTVLGVYAIQLATRLGNTSFLPSEFSDHLSSATAFRSDDAIYDRVWKTLMAKWIELTRLEKTASVIFFQSSSNLKQMLSANRYIDVIRHFMPTLDTWHRECVESHHIAPMMKDLLMIQFYHLRIIIKAISLQAVVNRVAAQTQQSGVTQIWDAGSIGNSISVQDQSFIRGLIEDCQSVLKIATSLAENRALRYAPLRILINITSASVFLLKAMSVGVRDSDLKLSLAVLEQSINVLKSSPVDDMDFSARYASLIENQVQRFKLNFKVSQPTRHNSPTPDLSAHGIAQMSQVNGSLRPMAYIPPVERNASNNTSVTTSNPPLVDGDYYQEGEENGIFTDEWWSQPFDPAVAPFNMSNDHLTWGFGLDSLDFLWNLPDG